MSQLISKILEVISEIILNYFESLRNDIVTQIVTAVWLIIGSTWIPKRVELQKNVAKLLTHPVYYDPKASQEISENEKFWYPFDTFQELRKGFEWFADNIKSLSDPVWSNLQLGIATPGFPEKILLGLTLLGFFYADIVIGFSIANERNLLDHIPYIFQFYGVAIAFATIGSAFASGLVAYEILRENSGIWQKKWLKNLFLSLTAFLFFLSIITVVGINAVFITSKMDLNPDFVSYLELTSKISLQILTRVNALLATLLIPFGAAFEGLLFVIAFLLSSISVIIRGSGVIIAILFDVTIRIITIIIELIIFIIESAPARIVSLIESSIKKA